MSASKDKKIRKQQIEDGTYKRNVAEEKAEKERRASRIRYISVAIALVVVFVFIFVYNSAIPSRATTAVTIDGEKYSVAELNYYYSSSYMSFYNNYYVYVSYGLAFDTSASLSDQEFSTMFGDPDKEYPEGYTWHDYFIDSAIDTMTEVQLLNKAADEAGFELSAEDQAEYDEAVEGIRTNWSDLGYSSLKQYIRLNYGKGVNMSLVEQELYRTYRASAYAEAVQDGYTYTTEELDAYYAEHADELDNLTYAYYVIHNDEESDVEIDADELAAAVNGTSAEEFTAYMEENYDGLTPTTETYSGENLSSVYADWLLGDRTAGDATAITDEEGDYTYVIMFLDRDSGDYNTVDFRHILINAEDADEDGAYSDEEIAAAEAEAEDIYDEWLTGEKTEDSFAALATEYSDDTGSVENGGLYEDTHKGEMVEAINDWLFEEGRQAGDTTIVTNNGSYTGAHVVYYVGQSDMTYARYQADTTLRSEAFTSWLDGMVDSCTVIRGHVRMAGQNR